MCLVPPVRTLMLAGARRQFGRCALSQRPFRIELLGVPARPIDLLSESMALRESSEIDIVVAGKTPDQGDFFMASLERTFRASSAIY
jgi:hypothetical protein